MTAPTPPTSTLVRPFTVSISDSEIDDLKQRLARTRWPDPETVGDWSQGVRVENARSLVDYWERGYDWRRFESELNRFPQFLTEIDGLDIHFIHVRSKNPNAMPLILTHGWPGSIVEFLKLIGPLTDPVSFGGDAADSFDVVVPSLPGFGFSQKPTETGWTVSRIASAWVELMKRLGYTRWAAQGGDWGAVVTTALGAMQPEGLLGIHLNTQYAFPAQIPDTLVARTALRRGDPRPLHRRSRWVEPPSGHEAGDRRIRPGGLSRRSGSLDLREVPVQDRQPRARRGRPQHRRHARRDIPLLVHQQRSVVRPHLLGEQDRPPSPARS